MHQDHNFWGGGEKLASLCSPDTNSRSCISPCCNLAHLQGCSELHCVTSSLNGQGSRGVSCVLPHPRPSWHIRVLHPSQLLHKGSWRYRGSNADLVSPEDGGILGLPFRVALWLLGIASAVKTAKAKRWAPGPNTSGFPLCCSIKSMGFVSSRDQHKKHPNRWPRESMDLSRYAQILGKGSKAVCRIMAMCLHSASWSPNSSHSSPIDISVAATPKCWSSKCSS